MTTGPAFRGATTCVLPASPSAAAASASARSTGPASAPGPTNARTVDPAPDRNAPSAPAARAAAGEVRQLRDRRRTGTARGGDRPSGPPGAPAGPRRSPPPRSRPGPMLLTASRCGTSAGRTRRMSSVESRRSGTYSTARSPSGSVKPDGLHPVAEVRRHDEPAEQHRRRVVRVRLDRRGDPQQLGVVEARPGQRVPGDDATHGGGRRRAQATRQRDRVVHRDPPADRRRSRPQHRLAAPPRARPRTGSRVTPAAPPPPRRSPRGRSTRRPSPRPRR